MKKFHINPETGNPGECSAQAGKCPFGGEEKHYASAAEARKAFEEHNAEKTLSSSSKKVGVRLQRRAEKYLAHKSLAEVPSTADEETLKNALAWAAVNERYPTVTHSVWVNPQQEFSSLNEYDGVDVLELGRKEFLVATPQGSLVEVKFRSGVEAQHDDYWEYYPELYADYTIYENLEKYKAKEPLASRENIDYGDHEIFQAKQAGAYSNLYRAPYDHSSSQDTVRIATQALAEAAKPYEVVKLAELQHFPGKLDPAKLAGERYFGQKSAAVRAAAVARREFPVSGHAAAVADPSPEVRQALAKREDISKETMEKLLTMSNRGTDAMDGNIVTPRHLVLRNPKLPLRMANKLVNEGSVEDLKALYYNPSLQPKTREKLELKAQQLGIRLYIHW